MLAVTPAMAAKNVQYKAITVDFVWPEEHTKEIHVMIKDGHVYADEKALFGNIGYQMGTECT